MSASKYAIAMHMSEEMWLDSLAMKYGAPFTRKVKSRTETPPTVEDVAEYERIKAMWEEVQSSPFWEYGYEEGYVSEPQPTVTIEYAETEAEYAARVRGLNPDDYKPSPTLIERLTEAMFAASRVHYDVEKIRAAVGMPEYTMPEWPPLQTVQINTKADIK